MSGFFKHSLRRTGPWALGATVVAAALIVSVGSAFPAVSTQSRTGANAVPAKKKPLRFHATCVRKRDHVTRIRFRAADGVRIAGMFFGRGKTTVVLAHQSDGTICTWVPFARRLKRLGYQAFAIDLRGHGASQRRGRLLEDADIVAAAKVARARGKTVILMGASLGGIAALSAAAQLAPAPPVISLSGPAEYGGMNATAAVRAVDFPILLAAASEDSPFAEDAQTLFSAARTTDKQLEMVPGLDHGLQLLSLPPSNARVVPLVDAFLARHAAR